jgi:hypothetical protein
MIYKIGGVSDFLGRIIIIFLPFLAEYAQAQSNSESLNNDVLSNEYLRNFAMTYSYLILIVGSIVFLVIGSVVGYFYPTPKYGVKPFPKWVKLLISITGGCLAFIYYLETKGDIKPIVIAWVACVSFVSPAIAHLIHAGAIKFTSLKTGVTNEDLESINKSFGDEE